jgi:putative heme-binding domain-containing protein
VRAWNSQDFAGDLAAFSGTQDFERGKRVFREALCSRCHRVGFEGGAVGPDLTSVGRRFSRADILESILSPSKVVAEQYRLAKIVTTKGETLAGQIIPSRDYRSPQLLLAAKPLEPYELTEISKAEIESFQISETSVMPKDLLNGFTKEEILALLAWLEAGGNPKHSNFR